MKSIKLTKSNNHFPSMRKFGLRVLWFTSTLSLTSLSLVSLASEEDSASYLDLTLKELLNIKVTSASGIEESLRDAAASMIIVTAQEISDRAYTDLGQVLTDLPGFDNIKS